MLVCEVGEHNLHLLSELTNEASDYICQLVTIASNSRYCGKLN